MASSFSHVSLEVQTWKMLTVENIHDYHIPGRVTIPISIPSPFSFLGTTSSCVTRERVSESLLLPTMTTYLTMTIARTREEDVETMQKQIIGNTRLGYCHLHY